MSERIMQSDPSFDIGAVFWLDENETPQIHLLEPQPVLVDEEAGIKLQEFVLRGPTASADEVRASLLVADAPSPAWHIKAGGSREVELPAGCEPCLVKVWRSGGHFQRIILEPRQSPEDRPLVISPGDTFQLVPMGERAAMMTFFRTPFHAENEERVPVPADPSIYWGTGR